MNSIKRGSEAAKKSAAVVVVLVAIIAHVSAVRITSLRVPSSFVLDEALCKPLILDCEYEFHSTDVGFVLKWYHNNHLIYQWIPPRAPYVFSSSKYRINTSFTITDNEKYKYRAISMSPQVNLTGDWMCSVQTYHTRDRRIKRLQVIAPEKSFDFYNHDLNIFMDNSEVLLVMCAVKRIFPEPELHILIGNDFNVISEVKRESDGKGFFNKSIMARIYKQLIPSPSAINCILQINGSKYIKRKQFIYYDPKYDENYIQNYEKLIATHHLKSSSASTFIDSLCVTFALIVFHCN